MSTAPLTTFGARVAFLRAKTTTAPSEPLSCSQIDRLAGLHRGHVWQIEQGTAENPKAETVRALSRVFGCTVGWLLAGEGDAPTEAAVRAAVERVNDARTETETAPRAA